MTGFELVLLLLACCLPYTPVLWILVPKWMYTRKLPSPAVGQIWVSQNNGERLRITEVRKHATGTIFWSYTIESNDVPSGRPKPPALPSTICGLDVWWEKLYVERRVFQ